jgi:hypothetical protein
MASEQIPNDGGGDQSFMDAFRASQQRKTTTLSAQQTQVVSDALQRIEIVRRDLAGLYADAEGGTILEHEVGECLTKVRGATKRLREALGNVAQMRLDMDAGPASGSGNRERH